MTGQNPHPGHVKMKLIADLFNKGRHHARGAEAICRHITLKMTSPHTHLMHLCVGYASCIQTYRHTVQCRRDSILVTKETTAPIV